MLQDTETETLKPHYIHIYKVFKYGWNGSSIGK